MKWARAMRPLAEEVNFMNKAITEGVVFMPPVFANGLTDWARGDGTPGSDTYDGTVTAAFVAADQDFGGCLEIVKTDATQKLRYMGETPMFPGCYLRITARVKAVSGPLPTVRIAGWAGGAGDAHVTGLTEIGPEVALTNYGEIVEISAIVGAGDRTGVDMVWGLAPLYGHFGLDLTGSNGAVVRIDDIEIEDITSVFLRDLINHVDVRDYGAIGDGVTDDHAAFVAAEAAADGRKIFVPSGTYFIGSSLTLNERVEFEGKLEMDALSILALTKDYDLPKYIDAFGGDEELAFRKAFQALLNNADHETLDMGGRRVTISEPLDLQAIEGTRTSFAQRRIIRNGQLYVSDGTAWDPDVVTSDASYDASDDNVLYDVSNIANIQIGSLVEGTGVGREVYVREVDIATSRITLSTPLYDAEGRQTFTFRRFKYVLDFSGFSVLSQFILLDLEILCRGYASGVMIARSGVAFAMKNCFINRPSHRGLTSIGAGCQGMFVEGCQFITDEGGTDAQLRTSVGMNANANDVKIRNNRASQFRHFAVLGGQNYLMSGNHVFQGDSNSGGPRLGGFVFTRTNVDHSFTSNYVDNCSVEWTNESSSTPTNTGGFSFSGMSITNNVFLCSDVAPTFGFVVIKPYGSGHVIRGLVITGNSFRSTKGTIERVDRVDTSFASLNVDSAFQIDVSGNVFLNVEEHAQNPKTVEFTQSSHSNTWSVSFEDLLPFGGRPRFVTGLVHKGKIKTAANVAQYDAPYVSPEQGSGGQIVEIEWEKDVAGTVVMTARMDD
ncbi:glycosyl hydrolase family 28-related protein [Planktotalea sp.]|uniref:glycosyl hydrolase family 28-related protein n=1 Tax=Planktotalea sp. TaxID=2029877 RepID=UPI0032985E4D